MEFNQIKEALVLIGFELISSRSFGGDEKWFFSTDYTEVIIHFDQNKGFTLELVNVEIRRETILLVPIESEFHLRIIIETFKNCFV